MVVIGLTGGIGTGKSEVAHILKDLGAAIISADQIGHESYARGTAAWHEVVAAFGPEVLTPTGDIDRQKLGERVFADPSARKRLDAILHPRMAQMMAQRIRQLQTQRAPAIVLEAALLVEAGWLPLVDEVWVVTASQETVLRRLGARNSLAGEAVRARIQSQLPQEQRLLHADVIIENDGDLEELRRRVADLWRTRILARTGEHAAQ